MEKSEILSVLQRTLVLYLGAKVAKNQVEFIIDNFLQKGICFFLENRNPNNWKYSEFYAKLNLLINELIKSDLIIAVNEKIYFFDIYLFSANFETTIQPRIDLLIATIERLESEISTSKND